MSSSGASSTHCSRYRIAALSDEAPDADGLCRSEQMVGTPRPQLVGDGEGVVEVLEVADPGEGRHVMDDRLRLRPRDRLAHRARGEAVHEHRLGTERAKPLELLGWPRRRDHVVAA